MSMTSRHAANFLLECGDFFEDAVDQAAHSATRDTRRILHGSVCICFGREYVNSTGGEANG